MPAPDDDDLADKYLLADELLAAAGSAGTRSATGPRARRSAAGTTSATGAATTGGASGRAPTSHVGGIRWWNVRHPAAYAARLAAGASPAQAREVLGDASGGWSRCCSGSGSPRAAVAALDAGGAREAAGLVADGLVDAAALDGAGWC